MEQMVAKFTQWVDESLSRSEPILNGLPPCPYAKEAILSGRFRWIECVGALNAELEAAIAEFLAGGKDAVMFVDPAKHSQFEIESCVYAFREKYYRNDVWVLFDDPRTIETQGGLNFNFGSSALIILQRLTRLEEASRDLERRGYYANWTPEYFQEVVLTRREYFRRMQEEKALDGLRAEEIL